MTIDKAFLFGYLGRILYPFADKMNVRQYGVNKPVHFHFVLMYMYVYGRNCLRVVQI